MLKVIKRNGDTAEFDLKRISDAIMKAFVATDVQYTNDIVDLLSLRVTADFQEKVVNIKVIGVGTGSQGLHSLQKTA